VASSAGTPALAARRSSPRSPFRGVSEIFFRPSPSRQSWRENAHRRVGPRAGATQERGARRPVSRESPQHDCACVHPAVRHPSHPHMGVAKSTVSVSPGCFQCSWMTSCEGVGGAERLREAKRRGGDSSSRRAGVKPQRRIVLLRGMPSRVDPRSLALQSRTAPSLRAVTGAFSERATALILPCKGR
jgi:hypothetical protein